MLIVRHGQSEWNAAGRWQGQEDPPLTDLGRQQALAAAAAIGSVDLVVASDLERAAETALIIAESIGVGPVLIDVDLRERHAGEWQGRTKDEIEQEWPGWLDAGRRPPGFEERDPFTERITAALERIAVQHTGADVLVVSHGGVIYQIEEWHDVPFERIPNLGGRHLRHLGERGRMTLGERVALVDDSLATVPRQI